MAQLVWAGSASDRIDDEGKPRCPPVKSLDDSAVTIVGRGKSSTLRVRQKLVSRTHAEVFRKGSKWFVKDTSTNGTYVNGYRVKKSALKNLDLVAFGALGPLSTFGELQENYKQCQTLFQFKLPPKSKNPRNKSKTNKRSQNRSAASASGLGGYKACENCHKVHGGKWGSGRFCSQSCAAQYSRKRGSQTNGNGNGATTSSRRGGKPASGSDLGSLPTTAGDAKAQRKRSGGGSSSRGSKRTKKDSHGPDAASATLPAKSRRRRLPKYREEAVGEDESKMDEESAPPKLEIPNHYPKPQSRRERLLRPSMMNIHLGTKMYRVEAHSGVRCYEKKDLTTFVRPEIVVRYGTSLPVDEVSGSWARVRGLWIPITMNGVVLLKEDRKMQRKRVASLQVQPPGAKSNKPKHSNQNGSSSKRSKSNSKQKSSKRNSNASNEASGESDNKNSCSSSEKKKKKKSFQACEVCGKHASWGSGRFCSRSCAAKLAAIACHRKNKKDKKESSGW
eukprot:CAMPEP_0197525816 /NCGR_PEP_ID=MMETSP1318-20131121/14654_1 /TAXON_ID=552666 /ORGANISM="Partenskyella glossopodia, Strain RCC365" /LENGTH=503 /DNA_ID=CAMNT_0043079583 /DNA_START=27 /DNA_END=1535 /DNA_ORIENTATION=+